MVNQRHQFVRLVQRFGGLAHHAERQSVDDEEAAGRRRGKLAMRLRKLRARGARKARTEIEDLDLPSGLRQLRDDTPVIDVTAGRGRQVARHREYHLLHRSGASYQARALGDSATVTRIDDSSPPGRPRPPVRAASASRS